MCGKTLFSEVRKAYKAFLKRPPLKDEEIFQQWPNTPHPNLPKEKIHSDMFNFSSSLMVSNRKPSTLASFRLFLPCICPSPCQSGETLLYAPRSSCGLCPVLALWSPPGERKELRALSITGTATRQQCRQHSSRLPDSAGAEWRDWTANRLHNFSVSIQTIRIHAQWLACTATILKPTEEQPRFYPATK